MKIGFIGTGIMGNAMCGHLINAGFDVNVYNRTKSKAENLIAKGAKWCDSPGKCSIDCDVIITIVGYPKDVEEVYLGEDGILNNARTGSYVVDMTTSPPSLAEKIFVAAADKKIHAVDAPVTGGDIGAKNAQLTIFVGGEAESFNALLPIFQAMGKNIFYMGKAGSGQHAKMCNQIAIAGALSGAVEAFAYAKSVGLDVNKAYDSISTGSAKSFQMTNVVKNGLDGNFDPGFMIKHFAKDLTIALQTATEHHEILPVLATILKEVKMLEKDHSNEGTQSLLKIYDVV